MRQRAAIDESDYALSACANACFCDHELRDTYKQNLDDIYVCAWWYIYIYIHMDTEPQSPRIPTARNPCASDIVICIVCEVHMMKLP